MIKFRINLKKFQVINEPLVCYLYIFKTEYNFNLDRLINKWLKGLKLLFETNIYTSLIIFAYVLIYIVKKKYLEIY